MSEPLKPVLEDMDNALGRLEQVIENQMNIEVAQQMEMSMGEEEQLDTMIASKLDNTIKSLETLLGEEE